MMRRSHLTKRTAALLWCVILLWCTTAPAATSDKAKHPVKDVTAGERAAQHQHGNASQADVAPMAANALFQMGYQYFTRNKLQAAAATLQRYLDAHTPDVEDYEWAQFFYGISLKRLGFTHAAVDTLTDLVTRKPNPQIVGYVLEILENISRTGPFDKQMLIHRALCDQSYGFIDGDVSHFVHYYQGEYDWSHGLIEWGDAHFAQLPEGSFYHNKYLFTHALRLIYDNRIDEAVALLKTTILKLENGDPLKDDARKTLARLYYEIGKFEEADFLYQQIEMNIVEQAQNLLERAWAHYRMGNAERAMGLLYSFEAPSYINSFTPEFYILKAFIYKDVCHYKTAMHVLDQFNQRYGQSLAHIYQRQPPHENSAMLLVLLNKPGIKQLWQFINLLEQEHELAQQNPDVALATYLDRLYSLKRHQVEKQFKNAVDAAYEEMADAMLQFEEEAHLMEYEIGIDMYQRVHTYHYDERTDQQETRSDLDGKAVYAFQGEFWNDELDNYQVVLPNKCHDAEEWDIFFK